ncbi:uncharacterized protein LOC106876641 [Octopus bimaculoides]|uniref:uncharacterized protein LOC106876641 n=1 Tax=Octopus bimaculoides TaxID=37653 RepID=UPI00071D5330|nr:uncharacterized protein LOC106876641 [Octopus bimaculoides]|eukprot:XP_014780739.1 PREDICTED: uncharacterized protein LOC106876641 [Octopus bimaculoides]
MDKIWHSAPIKYLQKKGLTSYDIHAEKVTILTDDAPDLSTVQKWAAEFRRESESLGDGTTCEWPATTTIEENIDRVRHMVTVDRRLTINQITNAVSVVNILHRELGMTKVSARWVSHLSTTKQKRTRMIPSPKNFALFEAD